MQIVIDIDEDVYKDAKKHMNFTVKSIIAIHNALNDCTVLPKGHGRLVDADAYRTEMFNSREFDFFKKLDMQPTIIKADKAESEK